MLQLSRMQEVKKWDAKTLLKSSVRSTALTLIFLGFIDHTITVNIVKDGSIVEKKELTLPKEIRNVIKCKNPRCITSVEQELDHVFILADPEKEVYRCQYCEEKYRRK